MVSGEILDTIYPLPRDMIDWDGKYDWNDQNCVGDRPFKGLCEGTVAREANEGEKWTIVVHQSSLYQDGPIASATYGSDTRIWVLDKDMNLNCSYRYYISRYADTVEQRFGTNYNQIFGRHSLDSGGFFVRCRVFYVSYKTEWTVDHCETLKDCDVPRPSKYLIFEVEANQHCSSIAWGQTNDTFLLTTDGDFYDDNQNFIGLYSYNIGELRRRVATGEIRPFQDEFDAVEILSTRLVFCLILFAFIACVWYLTLQCVENSNQSNDAPSNLFLNANEEDQSGPNYYLMSACLNSFVMGGLIFGIAALKVAMSQEGIFATECVCGSLCSAQADIFVIMGIIGLSGSVGSRLIMGLLLDNYGPKISCILSNVLFTVGIVLMYFATENESILFSGWFFVACGGSGVHISGMHFANLFTKSDRKVALTRISISMTASSLVFPMIQILVQYVGVSLKLCYVLIAIISIILCANNLYIQPMEAYQKHDKTETLLDPDAGEDDVHAGFCPLVCQFPKFWGIVLYFSVHYFAYSYYISSLNQYMFEYGDLRLTSEKIATDFLFTKIGAWMNGMGFIWLVHIKHLVQTTWLFFGILTVLHIMAFITYAIPILEIQLLSFGLMSFVRSGIFIGFFEFIRASFPTKTFGFTVGIGSFIAAIFALLVFPFQLMIVYSWSGNWYVGNIVILCALAASASWPAFLFYFK